MRFKTNNNRMRFRLTETIDRNEDRDIIAVHEAGHALLNYLYYPNKQVEVNLNLFDLGGETVCNIPMEFTNQNDCEKYLKVALGGIAATELICGQKDTGGSGDIRDAISVVDKMFNGGCLGLEFSDETANHSEKWLQDKEKKENDYLNGIYKEAKTDLKKKKLLLQKMAEKLLIDGSLDREEIDALSERFDKRP